MKHINLGDQNWFVLVDAKKVSPGELVHTENGAIQYCSDPEAYTIVSWDKKQEG